MSSKMIVMMGMTIGSVIGGYLPVLFGVSMFSSISVIGSFIGGLLGIVIGYKISNY